MEYIISDAFHFEKLRVLFPYLNNHDGIIAGGVFKDIFLDKNFRDIDVFFTCESEFLKCIRNQNSSNYYIKKYENDNAIGFEENFSKIRVDFVRKRFGSPREILDSFDFSVSKFALYKDKENIFKVIYHPLFFSDLVTKTLRYDSTVGDPVLQFSRILKYSRYGFKINKADQINLIINLSQLENIDALFFENYDEYYYHY
jgi:hypothetical protein